MKYFEKIAFRYNKPGHIKKFVLMSENELMSAALRQGASKKLIGIVKPLLKTTPGGMKMLVKALKKPKNPFTTMGGTIFETPKGRSVAINKDLWKSWDRSTRRNVLAHEAFHANVPILGQSEILTHAYGGSKSIKGKRSLKKAIGQIKHLKETRPERLYSELGGLAAVGSAAAAGVHSLKKKYKK